MKVKDLINMLQKQDPNAELVIIAESPLEPEIDFHYTEFGITLGDEDAIVISAFEGTEYINPCMEDDE